MNFTYYNTYLYIIMITVICGIMFINDKDFIIAQRPSSYEDPNKWEFPGGKLEHNETYQQCLIREWKEELNLDIQIKQQIYITENDKYKLVYFNGKVNNLNTLQMKEHKAIALVNTINVFDYDLFDEDKPMIQFIKP